jgi:protoporphyrinogen/coproporphyrinogen III oxidase
LNKYEGDRVALEQSTGIAVLYSIGRNGEFSHLLMENVYWRTQKKMREVRADLMQMQDNLAPSSAPSSAPLSAA